MRPGICDCSGSESPPVTHPHQNNASGVLSTIIVCTDLRASSAPKPCRKGVAMSFDLVIRNARVATASDTFDCRHRHPRRPDRRSSAPAWPAARARSMPPAASSRPGGVDAHCHLDQPMERRRAWPTTSTPARARRPAAAPPRSSPSRRSRRASRCAPRCDDYHGRAEGNAHVDYAFHLIVSDPTPTRC